MPRRFPLSISGMLLLLQVMRMNAMYLDLASPHRITMTVNEFTEQFGISRQTFYNEVRAGRLGMFKVGRKTLIPKSEAARWYNERLIEAGICSVK
jgi:excisionase family DNA binding protein